MKKRLQLAGICLIAIITGCASGNTVALSEEKSATAASTKQEANVVENSDKSTVSVPKEKADILEKYPELISYLESEDYQSAETYVHDLVLQQKKEAAEDIGDYLVTVDLNSENFEDYFELAAVPRYNAFGEPVKGIQIGVKSKKFDEGLIVYSVDDITVEFKYSYDSDDSECDLQTLLSFNLSTYSGADDDSALAYTGRITEGTVTFIKREYVEDYPVPELKKPDDYTAGTTIQLKNGEIINRYLYPEYPY